MTITTFVGTLKLTICDAKDLKTSYGKKDPYCKVSLGDAGLGGILQGQGIGKERFKTKPHQSGGSNPVWNESHLFDLQGMGPEVRLKVALYDDDMFKDDYLGLVEITLAELMKHKDGKFYYDVLEKADDSRVCGRLSLIAKFDCTQIPEIDEQKIAEQEKPSLGEKIKATVLGIEPKPKHHLQRPVEKAEPDIQGGKHVSHPVQGGIEKTQPNIQGGKHVSHPVGGIVGHSTQGDKHVNQPVQGQHLGQPSKGVDALGKGPHLDQPSKGVDQLGKGPHLDQPGKTKDYDYPAKGGHLYYGQRLHTQGGEHQRLDQPTHQRLDQPTHQRLDQPTHQRLDQPTHQRLDQPTHQRLDQPTHQRLDQPTHQRLDQPTHQRLDQPTHTGQRVDQPTLGGQHDTKLGGHHTDTKLGGVGTTGSGVTGSGVGAIGSGVSTLGSGVSTLGSGVSTTGSGVSTTGTGVSTTGTTGTGVSTTGTTGTGVSTTGTTGTGVSSTGTTGTGVSSTGTGVSSTGTGVSSTGTGVSSTGSGVSSTGSGVSSTGSGVSSLGSGVSSTGSGVSSTSQRLEHTDKPAKDGHLYYGQRLDRPAQGVNEPQGGQLKHRHHLAGDIDKPTQSLDQPTHGQRLDQPTHDQRIDQPTYGQIDQPTHGQRIDQPTHSQQIDQPIHGGHSEQSTQGQLKHRQAGDLDKLDQGSQYSDKSVQPGIIVDNLPKPAVVDNPQQTTDTEKPSILQQIKETGVQVLEKAKAVVGMGPESLDRYDYSRYEVQPATIVNEIPDKGASTGSTGSTGSQGQIH